MNLKALCAAVQEAPWYLERFTHRGYRDAFRQYTKRFGPVCMEAVRETAGEETALAALADALLDELETGWKRQRFWNRTAVRVSEKQMVVSYLSPMLLGLGEPDCRRLAEVLRDRWAARWPKDGYRIAEYAVIQSGFKDAIMGIPVSVLGKRDEDEA